MKVWLVKAEFSGREAAEYDPEETAPESTATLLNATRIESEDGVNFRIRAMIEVDTEEQAIAEVGPDLTFIAKRSGAPKLVSIEATAFSSRSEVGNYLDAL